MNKQEMSVKKESDVYMEFLDLVSGISILLSVKNVR